jgi:hypothetical protein
MKAASVFPYEHLVLLRMAAGVNKYFGLRRAVSECDHTDTFGAECFCIGHATPRPGHPSKLYVKQFIRNNPWVGGYLAAK